MGVKLSVSLPDADVELLDAVAEERNESRSAALQRAVRLLRESRLGDQYEQVWKEWEESGEAAVWDVTAGDGITGDEAW